jgi:hypothetical protein
MFFVLISESTTIISLSGINQMVSVMENQGFSVETEFLNIIYMNFRPTIL